MEALARLLNPRLWQLDTTHHYFLLAVLIPYLWEIYRFNLTIFFSSIPFSTKMKSSFKLIKSWKYWDKMEIISIVKIGNIWSFVFHTRGKTFMYLKGRKREMHEGRRFDWWKIRCLPLGILWTAPCERRVHAH